MNERVARIDKFHRRRWGKLAFGLIELLLSYAIISRAIDTGSIWEWIIGLILAVGGIINLVKILGRQKNKDENKTKRR